MKKKTIAYSFLPLILFCLFNNLFGQDSLRLDEIVITATKTERSLSKIPLPVTSISAKEIHALGSIFTSISPASCSEDIFTND